VPSGEQRPDQVRRDEPRPARHAVLRHLDRPADRSVCPLCSELSLEHPMQWCEFIPYISSLDLVRRKKVVDQLA
jgi:hypothetical protein